MNGILEIFGGGDVNEDIFFKDMDWMGYVTPGDSDFLRCGISLIDPEWVISAEHCKVEPGYKVHFGSIRMNHSPITRTITEIIDMDGTEFSSDWIDMAIFKLDEPITEIKPVAVNDVDNVKIGTDVYAFGWGANIKDAGYPEYLQKGDFVTIRYGNEWILNVVGKETGTTPCFGDSGGPLVSYKPDIGFVLLGITSAFGGGPCGGPNTVGIYPAVDRFQDQIKNSVKNIDWVDGVNGIIPYDWDKHIDSKFNKGYGPGCQGYFDYIDKTSEPTCIQRGLVKGNPIPSCDYDNENVCKVEDCCWKLRLFTSCDKKHLWAIDDTERAGGNLIYKKSGDEWINIPGEVIMIAPSNDELWTINKFGGIWVKPDNSRMTNWKSIPGNLDDISYDCKRNKFLGIKDGVNLVWDKEIWTSDVYCFKDGKKYGYTLKKINGLSPEQCQLSCNDDNQCIRADQYKNGNCYLRKYKDTNKWSTGIKGGGIVDNKKQYGYTLKKICGTSGIQECKALCNDDVNCSHYDLYKPNGNCYLRYMKGENGWQTTEKDCGYVLSEMNILENNNNNNTNIIISNPLYLLFIIIIFYLINGW